MKKNHILPIFLVIQIVLVKTLAFFPDFIENWYSKGLYAITSNFSRQIFGVIPFSVGDVLYIILIFFVVRWIWCSRKDFFKNWRTNSLQILSFLSLFYFAFHFLWGMNYYRIPIHEKLNIEEKYSEKELEEFTEKIIKKLNFLQEKIVENDSKAVNNPYDDAAIFGLAIEGYRNLPLQLQDYEYKAKSIKKSLISLPLSYMGFGGYLNPFTNEAQVNYLKPKYTTPFTTCHEIAHQTGIGSESECNFVGFLAASKHPDDYFKYAAYATAVSYCFRNLEMIEEGKSNLFKAKLNKGVLLNFEENERYWQHYDTPVNSFFESFYDNFLKANQQKDGMEGYSKFIGLLIGYEKVAKI